jgi:hypothetical protein
MTKQEMRYRGMMDNFLLTVIFFGQTLILALIEHPILALSSCFGMIAAVHDFVRYKRVKCD